MIWIEEYRLHYTGHGINWPYLEETDRIIPQKYWCIISYHEMLHLWLHVLPRQFYGKYQRQALAINVHVGAESAE